MDTLGTIKVKKKLIEVALPLEAINKASAREKSIRHGHPSTFHLWWARRPLAAARAMIFAQMVDDPSSRPELFPTEEAQEKERQRLFGLIEELVRWENTTNEEVLERARAEIRASWRMTCADNVNHPRAKELFDPEKLPAFHDPFAGGGSLPLEAQRLGLESYASDLNPVAVLINKAMIEIPPQFAGISPVNPRARIDNTLIKKTWCGTQGLADDVRYYAQLMRDEAEKLIGHLYPKIEITTEMAYERPDLRALIGRKLTVIAWLWARTVKSPSPAFSHINVPLTSSFMLSTKKGKESCLEPLVSENDYSFAVKVGSAAASKAVPNGTKFAQGANFQCIMSGTPITGDYIRSEGKAGRIGSRLMAIVLEGEHGRIYLPPIPEHEDIAHKVTPTWKPEIEFFEHALGFRVGNYGMSKWSDLFTPRQLLALSTLSDLVLQIREQVIHDEKTCETPHPNRMPTKSEKQPLTYADAIALYLALGVSRQVNRSANLNFWDPQGENIQQVFAMQTLSMKWDYVEGNPFSESSGNFLGQISYLTNALEAFPALTRGEALQRDAATQEISLGKIISSDPPYFDNVGYADLSDFFYVWLRPSMKSILPNLFTTMSTPKANELVATPARHGGKENAETFFLDGMSHAMSRLSQQTHPAFPVSIYYAFKQSETDQEKGTASTGWEAFLDSVIRAGFEISGTWPVRTEYTGNLKTKRNALASSIVLVCRSHPTNAITTTRREFLNVLKAELPIALAHLQHSNIAPVDLAQAAIGPGMAIYTRYAKVLDAEGKALSVREALTLINQTLDQVLAEQEGYFDADTRWALAWFEQCGFIEGEYGMAETLSKAKNTNITGLVTKGILTSKSSKVRLLQPSELPNNWDRATDLDRTVWESTHHIIRAFEISGESAAAELVAKLGSNAETARELAYRLYTICERKRWAKEALSYNALVQSWPEISRLSREESSTMPEMQELMLLGI